MADKETEVTNVNTDFESAENPLDSNGYVGVDPYFQGAPLKNQSVTKELASEDDAEEKKTEAPKAPAAPAAPATTVTPPK